MAFPATRLRRLRRTGALRSMVRETRLSPENFVYPLFVCPGEGVRKEVRSMPGVFNLSVDETVKEAREAQSLGIPALILFGLPEKKDEIATGAWDENGIVQRAARAIKAAVPDMVVIGDVCLCEYMSHGHCGVVRSSHGPRSVGAAARESSAAVAVKRGAVPKAIDAAAAKLAHQPEYEIVNDATLELLEKTSVSLARAGVDIIAPSDMMDGRVAAIRKALDPILRSEIFISVLWTVPRGCRFRAAVRRPAFLSDGRSEYSRSDARDRTRHRRRRGHGDGQARHAISGCDSRRAGAIRPAHCRLPGFR
jgi:porphobilinogen synthase